MSPIPIRYSILGADINGAKTKYIAVTNEMIGIAIGTFVREQKKRKEI